MGIWLDPGKVAPRSLTPNDGVEATPEQNAQAARGGVGQPPAPRRSVPYTAACTIPDWLLQPPTRPRVCVSMGTVPIPEGVDGLTAAVQGLRGLAVGGVVFGGGVHH